MAVIPAALGVVQPSLRAIQLKRLCFLCGLSVSGRKEELVARLEAAAQDAPLALPKSRTGPVVLSIDLGIRNLAFSLMVPVSQKLASTSRKKVVDTNSMPKKKKKLTMDESPPSGTGPPTVELHAWQRLSLLEGPARTLAENDDKGTPDKTTLAEVFTPAALAKTTNIFLQETVLRFKPLPTHILIERQRWRSGGAAAIQEWTVRVNTLEAMLHASLRTLNEVGFWKGEVISVRPERVGQLFLDAETTIDGEELSTRKRIMGKRKTSTETKKLKIGLLGRWLDQGDFIVRPYNKETGRTLYAYQDALKNTAAGRRKRISVAGKTEAEETSVDLGKKLDDLTDSLLQGMAWLRWQDNLTLLRGEGGVEKLLGSDT